MPRPGSRTFSMTLDTRTNDAVLAYMHAQGLAKPDAVRELIMTAMASLPEHGQVQAAKNKAYFECKRWAMTRLSEFFTDLLREINDSIQELANVG